MQRNFLRGFLVCLIPCLLAGFFAFRGPYRLGIDLAGGTILVYEVDAAKLPQNFNPQDLAAALKRRIDPADLYNVTIRPVAGNPPRVEIILPTGGRHQTDAEKAAWEDQDHDEVPQEETAA